jgi:hypothetical protein
MPKVSMDDVLTHALPLPLLQVMVTCLCGYLVHWFERAQRLKFKKQVPPAVAAMQKHLYGLPTGLKVAQVCVHDSHPQYLSSCFGR